MKPVKNTVCIHTAKWPNPEILIREETKWQMRKFFCILPPSRSFLAPNVPPNFIILYLRGKNLCGRTLHPQANWKPKPTPYILFFLHLGKGRFLAGWPEFWPTVVFCFNLFDITIVKVFQVIKNSLHEISLFHSLNGGWHSSRAGKPLICCTVSQQFRGRILAPFCSLILRTAAQVVHTKSLETSTSNVRHAMYKL